VAGVAVDAVPEDLGLDRGTARLGVREGLQQQHRAALAGEDARPVPVERRARVLGEGAEPEEPGVGPPADRVRATGQHHVGFAADEQVVGVAQGVVAGRAGRGDGQRLAGQAQFLADRVGEPVGAQPAQQLRVLAGETTGDQLRGERFRHLRFAAGGPHDGVGPPGHEIVEVESGVADGQPGRARGELARPAPPGRLEPLEVPGRVEAGHLPGVAVREARGVEAGDP
jgi:hypothetical protein